MTLQKSPQAFEVPPPYVGGYLDGSDINPAPFEMRFQAFVDAYGKGTRRRELLANLMLYLQTVRRKGDEIVGLWVAGSFVSNKPEPRDLDISSFVRQETPGRFDVDSFVQKHNLEFWNSTHGINDKPVCWPVTHPEDVRRLAFLSQVYGHERETFNRRGWVQILPLAPNAKER